MQAPEAQQLFQRIAGNIEKVMRGQHAQVRKLLAAFAAGGHVLVDDFPGTGKTTLAKSLAASIGARFARVQFTPDLLPSDILGVSVFNQRDQSFEFREGPVFTSILLADEINRASPRTQSALLEVMAESQVSVEGRTHPMDQLFFVVATQNPVEFRGTYPLPEAQMDRFALCLALGYVDADTEVAVLAAQDLGHPLDAIRRGGERARRCSRSRTRRATCASPTRSATTWWSWCAARARRRRCCSAAGRAPRSRSPTPPRRSRSSMARTTCGPSTCKSWRCPRSRTAWCSTRRRASPGCPRRASSPTSCGR